MQIGMMISTLSSGRSFVNIERGSLDKVDVVIGVSISYWNPFFPRHLNVLRIA